MLRQQQRRLSDHDTDNEIILAAWMGNKPKLINMLRSELVSEETLYLIMKQMIEKKNKSTTDWAIIQLIVNDPRFNPNYYNESLKSICRLDNKNIFSFTNNWHLAKIAITHECYPSLNLLLEHPKMDFEKLRDIRFFKIALEKNIFKTVNWLLRNPSFFALENDWLAWAEEKCSALKIVFALNFCWHHWSRFTRDLLDQGLCGDAIDEVARNLCYVSLFAKKESGQTNSNECSPRRGLR